MTGGTSPAILNADAAEHTDIICTLEALARVFAFLKTTRIGLTKGMRYLVTTFYHA